MFLTIFMIEYNGEGEFMQKIDFQKFFDGNDAMHYDSKYPITILERILEKSFDEIKTIVIDAKVIVSEVQIKEFLEQKLEEEDPELKQRVEKRRLDYEKNLKKQKNSSENDEKLKFDWKPFTDKEIQEASKKLTDTLAMNRYEFEPYTLKYFNRYIKIVKNKLLTLLDIIEKIKNKDTSSIQDLMIELDIVLDESGNISKEDIIRLLEPIIYNFSDLNKKVEEANELSTYLTFKMSKHSLMRNGWSENEIYPTKSLQNHGLFDFNEKGNVPLSSRQEQKRREEQKRNLQTAAKLILHL